MKTKSLDKIGLPTPKVHDLDTKTLAKKENYHIIKKIDTFYNLKDGIYGFFPFFDNPALDQEIVSKEDSFYPYFKQNCMNRLKVKEHKLNSSLIHKEIIFEKNEYIRNFKLIYDEDNKKITAIKFVTSKNTYSIGKEGDMNNKIQTHLSKPNSFISGFKTSYMEDNQISYLSFIKVYYENENNLEKYFKKVSPNRMKMFCNRQIKNASSLFTSIAKAFLILFILIFPFCYYYLKSQNIYGGEITISKDIHGLSAPVKIHTDKNGFFHIKAESNKDSYFALGFVHAKERLWQMDFNRRLASGKLSEIFGLKTLEVDKIIRSLGLNEMAKRFEISMRSHSKNLIEFESYIRGINYYARNFILPPEYHVFRMEWIDWTLKDSIAVSNLMTLTLTHDWNMEIWYKMMEENLGKEFAELVLSYRDYNYPFWNETIVSDEDLLNLNLSKKPKMEKKEPSKSHEEIRESLIENNTKIEEPVSAIEEQIHVEKNATHEVISTPPLIENNTKIEETVSSIDEQTHVDNNAIHEVTTLDSLEDIQNTEEKPKDLPIPPLNSQGASNSWVISGQHTQSGFPILSNDPHLTNSMPSLFFISKIYLPHNTIVGSSIPGLPYFVTGANNNISWGFTTENSDSADLCEEKVEDNFYIKDNKKIRLKVTQENIYVKNSEPISLEIKWTQNGPLLSKSIPKELLVVNYEFKYNTPLSIRFAFYLFEYKGSDFYFALNHATDPTDFLPEIDKHTAPNLNLVYATKGGEIGWVPTGSFPLKNYKNRLCRGYSSDDDIIDFIKREELPKLQNPSKGYIIAANNRPYSFDYKYDTQGFYNNVRAFRIRQLVEDKLQNSQFNFTLGDSVEIMQDLKDPLAEYMLTRILEIVRRNTPPSKIKSLKFFEELKSWNYSMDKNSALPTIYSVLELYLGKQMLKNKINDQEARGVMSLLHYWNFISGTLDKIFRGERVDLKQCAHLSGNVNCEKYIVYIYNNLDKFLLEADVVDKLGRIKNWGDVKQNHYPHNTFEVVPLVNNLFSRTVPTGGNRNTVKIARGPFNNNKGSFYSTHSPRFKFVADMVDPSQPFLIMDGGNSGNILSSFYNNLMLKCENTELIKFENVDFSTMKFPDANNILLIN